MVCSNFLFLPVSVLVVYLFLGICPFLPDCPFYWHRIAHNNLLLLFLFLLCWLLSLLFHSWFYLFGSFPFSFWSNWLVVINFFNSFKEPAFGFIILFYCFLVLIALISALIFIISCLLLALGFICCSFSSSLRCKVRLCIWDLSSFVRKPWIAIYFPVMSTFSGVCWPFGYLLWKNVSSGPLPVLIRLLSWGEVLSYMFYIYFEY